MRKNKIKSTNKKGVGVWKKRKFCGSRLANQSSRKESLEKSNGFASKPTESHSFPRLLILTLHLSLSLSLTIHTCIYQNICLYIYICITSKFGNTKAGIGIWHLVTKYFTVTILFTGALFESFDHFLFSPPFPL